MKRFLLAFVALFLAVPAQATSVYATDPTTGQTKPAELVISATQPSGGPGTSTAPFFIRNADGILTVTTTITRPSDTTQYAALDAYSDSTSAPTTGGFTFTSAARASGKSVILTDLMIIDSNATATPLQGTLFIYDTAVTNINDNAAFTISDGQALTQVAKIPFTMETGVANNTVNLQNLNIGITTVASANLFFVIRVENTYTPASAETLTFRAKFLPVD